eukprot:363011-Chlamydomonas_euryale.AAC.4
MLSSRVSRCRKCGSPIWGFGPFHPTLFTQDIPARLAGPCGAVSASPGRAIRRTGHYLSDGQYIRGLAWADMLACCDVLIAAACQWFVFRTHYTAFCRELLRCCAEQMKPPTAVRFPCLEACRPRVLSASHVLLAPHFKAALPFTPCLTTAMSRCPCMVRESVTGSGHMKGVPAFPCMDHMNTCTIWLPNASGWLGTWKRDSRVDAVCVLRQSLDSWCLQCIILNPGDSSVNVFHLSAMTHMSQSQSYSGADPIGYARAERRKQSKITCKGSVSKTESKQGAATCQPPPDLTVRPC